MELSASFWSGCALFATAFLLSYLYHGLGITLGYHRILTHKSVTLPKWLERFITYGGYLCLMGSPVVWVAVHRLHHQKSDIEGDPHSPQDGFGHALVGWMTNMSEHQTDDEVRSAAADVMADPFYRILGTGHTAAQAMGCLITCILFRVLLWVVFGPIVAIANTLAMTIVFWSTQFVNTFCHMDGHGYRSYTTREYSRNCWWVAVLTLGEGWHNNHHAVAKSARHGLAPHEIDITWMTISLFEKLGLAKDVILPNPTVLSARSIQNGAPVRLEPLSVAQSTVHRMHHEEEAAILSAK